MLGEPIEICDDEAEPIAGQPLDEGPRPRLLLVDDDPDLRKMFSLLLERRGFEVTTAVDGVEGGEKARDGQYAVVVADLSMPRLDGWGLLRQLRDDYRTRELPIAFLSCHDDYREQLRAFDSGAQAYLSKSVRHDALVQQIHALLGPREKVARDLAEGRTLGPLKLDELGAQWLLEALEGAGKTGLLVAKDGWASYSLFLERGEPVHAVAEAGVHTAEGERAFNAFLASRRAEATFREGEPAPSRSLSGGRAALVARAVALLNENDRRAKESVMVGAKQIQVNDALYALYLQVAGANATEAARLLCEKKLPPGAVIAQMDASPLEVEELIRDLVRRGVGHARLSRGSQGRPGSGPGGDLLRLVLLRQAPVLEALEQGRAGDAELLRDPLAVVVVAAQRALDDLALEPLEHLLQRHPRGELGHRDPDLAVDLLVEAQVRGVDHRALAQEQRRGGRRCAARGCCPASGASGAARPPPG